MDNGPVFDKVMPDSYLLSKAVGAVVWSVCNVLIQQHYSQKKKTSSESRH